MGAGSGVAVGAVPNRFFSQPSMPPEAAGAAVEIGALTGGATTGAAATGSGLGSGTGRGTSRSTPLMTGCWRLVGSWLRRVTVVGSS